MVMSGGEGCRYCSKKTDSLCHDCCCQGSSRLGMSRLRCIMRGLDIKTYILLFALVSMCVFVIYLHGQKISYFLRPLWEKPPKTFHQIPHYYSQNLTMEKLCKLHGWGVREYPRRVYDAVLFSNEVEILKIRWKELYPYITQFVLLESNSTFTGLPKPLVFSANRDKFKFVEPRLTYGTIGGPFKKGENPFVEEAYQRVALDHLIGIARISDDDLLIMSDFDEIPSRHTIDLLRCWRASVHWHQTGKTKYAHFRQTDYLLADEGWPRSFCFRHISELVLL